MDFLKKKKNLILDKFVLNKNDLNYLHNKILENIVKNVKINHYKLQIKNIYLKRYNIVFS